MIRRVWSSLPTFREVNFAEGMNIILADQAADSSDKESRNGLGKTTLLRIIHFCLGSDFSRERVLNHPLLNGYDFGLDFEVCGRALSVARNTADARQIVVREGAEHFPDIAEYVDVDENGAAKLTVVQWTDFLGRAIFGLDDRASEASLSFRGLIGFFGRLGRQAFNDPFDYVGKQKAWQKRTQVAFLLGLNWQQTYQWHILQQQSDDIRNLLSAQKAAEQSSEIETVGDLEARLVAVDLRLEQKRRDLSQFEVRDDYHYIEDRLNETDRDLHQLVNDNHTDRRLLEYYLESTQELTTYRQRAPSTILEEAGAVFREESLRTLSDVAEFHRQVYENRRSFLQAEVNRLRGEIAERTQLITGLAHRKSDLLRVLRSTGAVETFFAMQEEFRDLTSEREAISARVEERKRYDRLKDEISLKLSQLKLEVRSDFEGRQHVIDEERKVFSQYTGALYEKPGLLVVNVDKSGLRFDVVIEREGSDGVDQMVVFCFDLLLANIWQRRTCQPNFLLHDSSVFADVDSRQRARALKLAAEESALLGFQYICCLNSDTLPTEHLGDFRVDEFVRLRLSDAEPETRLLGIELPPHQAEDGES